MEALLDLINCHRGRPVNWWFATVQYLFTNAAQKLKKKNYTIFVMSIG